MYREPDETPRCACCRSTDLTDATMVVQNDGACQVCFIKRVEQRGMFAEKYEYFSATRGRICRKCGHVMTFLDTKALVRLLSHGEHIEPVAET